MPSSWAIPNSSNSSVMTMDEFNRENNRLIEARKNAHWDLKGNPLFGDASKIVTGWQPSEMGPSTQGGEDGRIGSPAGALGSKGMPTSVRGRFEKYGIHAASMPTHKAADIARRGGLFGGTLKELYDMNRDRPGYAPAPAPQQTLSITQPQPGQIAQPVVSSVPTMAGQPLPPTTVALPPSQQVKPTGTLPMEQSEGLMFPTPSPATPSLNSMPMMGFPSFMQPGDAPASFGNNSSLRAMLNKLLPQ
jgi:hypothetical protein